MEPKKQMASSTREMSWQDAARLFVVLIIGWLPLLFGRGYLGRAAELFSVIEPVHTVYFVPDHAGLLYVLAPLAGISACLFLLSPGILLAVAVNAAESIGHWMLYSLSFAILLVSIAAGIVQEVWQTPLLGSSFVLVVVACSLACFVFLIVRIQRGANIVWPLQDRYAWQTLLFMWVIPFLLLIIFAPKFYWESFNGDGAHAFEASRLLLQRPFPFWPAAAGEVSSFPGMTSLLFTYPTSWFIRLFGELEVAARLPYLLYLPALHGVVLALVQRGRKELLPIPEQLLIWLGLLIYTVVMGYSATYSPYLADFALPATQDTLVTICFLGFALAFVEEKRISLVLFAAFTYFASPNGLLLLGFWWVAAVLVQRPFPWVRLGLTAVSIVSVFVLASVFPRVLQIFGYPGPGGEYGMVGLLGRFAFLQLTDLRRALYVLVPTGFLPAIALFAWPWQGLLSRTLTLVTIFYFFFFYVQAHISLHHFSPVMLFPLIVFWRIVPLHFARRRRQVLLATGVASFLALWISLPQHFDIHTVAKEVGSYVSIDLEGYDRADPALFKATESLTVFFPYDWDPEVPDEKYGGSPLVWNYYAHHASKEDSPNYLVLSVDKKPEAGMKLIAQEDGLALYVRDEALWKKHQALRPPTPAGSLVYKIPRGILFRSVPLTEGPRVINVIDVLAQLGIDTDSILERLGVRQ